ncbi:hypothetical protein COV17_01145 [Candidatus Woesearchaeota archaeon CG10_big_fil_rev_8_21_14_0_10_36_11]|nr:MAG: hypothetical protein COV17_01145 [Candidatus Woesearchaeota archaeon CG10_big_fil_rev_8_21_14_0_10_36_11]
MNRKEGGIHFGKAPVYEIARVTYKQAQDTDIVNVVGISPNRKWIYGSVIGMKAPDGRLMAVHVPPKQTFFVLSYLDRYEVLVENENLGNDLTQRAI